MLTAYDSAANLVQLGEPEALGVQNGDDGGVRDIHPDLHHGGADEDIDTAIAELFHHFLFFVRFHSAVEDVAGEVGENVCREVFVFFFH